MAAAIQAYRLGISPLLGPGKCRFYPSCSEYAAQAVAQDGPWRGGWRALKRISRCHPLSGHGGVDLP
jgi:putative membrane protein insertion efficiency factor